MTDLTSLKTHVISYSVFIAKLSESNPIGILPKKSITNYLWRPN